MHSSRREVSWHLHDAITTSTEAWRIAPSRCAGNSAAWIKGPVCVQAPSMPAGRCADLHLATDPRVLRLVMEGQAPLLDDVSALAGGHDAGVDQDDLIFWARRPLAAPLPIVHHQTHIDPHLGSCQPCPVVPAEWHRRQASDAHCSNLDSCNCAPSALQGQASAL